MFTAQKHLSIEDIAENIVLLKDGGGSLVIKTSAVNFGLLSDMEQIAIISSFAQMLNSLSFSIQILIQSQRLDITSYISLLDIAQRSQTNPLLASMIAKYRQFIQSLVKENEVLDKQFYIVLNVSSIELGLGVNKKEDKINKIKTILNPRRDQILRQLGRIGLRSEQLSTDKLVKLFYDIYNQTSTQETQPAAKAVNLIQPVRLVNPNQNRQQVPAIPQTAPIYPTLNSPVQPTPSPSVPTTWQQPAARNHPFVVEELAG